MKFTLLALLFTFSLPSFAGFTKGNGGNILACTDRPNMVLDYFEVTELHQLNVAKNFNDPQFFIDIESRIAKLSPSLVPLYREAQKTINSRLQFIDSPLESVNDAYVVIIPNDCELEQTAVQLNGRVLVNRAIYAALSSAQQQALLLHESFYFIMLQKMKLEDSRRVRAMVSLLLSEEILTMSSTQIDRFLRENDVYIK